MGGALAEPVDSALFVWKNSTAKVGAGKRRWAKLYVLGAGSASSDEWDILGVMQEIEEFVKADPYIINGLVTDW